MAPSLSVALWEQWGERFRDFVLNEFAKRESVLPAPDPHRCDAILPVRLALVPQADNEYNSDAIMVCAAPSTPGAAPGPAVGYMRESYLYRNSPWIHRLDDLNDRPVVCHGWIELDRFNVEEWDEEDDGGVYSADIPLTIAEMREHGWAVGGVRLNLPAWSNAADLVGAYVAAHPRVTGSEADEVGAAERAGNWREWAASAPNAGQLHAKTTSAFGASATWVVTATGVRVGRHEPRIGVPVLFDERLREQAHAALLAHGIAVDSSTSRGNGFARATVRVTDRSWEIFEVVDGYPAADLPMIASFDLDTGTLSAWARPHLEPVAALLRRHGAQVRRTVWRNPPHDVRVHNGWVTPAPATGITDQLRLLPALRPLLTDDEAQVLNVTWGPAPALSEREGTRVTVSSSPSLGALGPCELCGLPASGATSALTFCDGCTRAAFAGRVRDTGIDGVWTDVAVRALQRLSKLEFSGPPSLDQLSQLPQGGQVPEAMLLRMLVPRPSSALPVVGATRGTRSWEDWLAVAGLLTGAYRASLGTWSVATDGHVCRSMFERTVDDYLHHHRIEHEPEPHYPWHAELNTTGLRADWRMADGTFVEALGMLDDAEYASKAARKVSLAAQTGIQLVTLTPRNVRRLSQVFARWLPTDTLEL